MIVGARVFLIFNKYINSLSSAVCGYGDGLNMYAYVGNDPMNYTDPWGLNKVDDDEAEKKEEEKKKTLTEGQGGSGGRGPIPEGWELADPDEKFDWCFDDAASGYTKCGNYGTGYGLGGFSNSAPFDNGGTGAPSFSGQGGARAMACNALEPNGCGADGSISVPNSFLTTSFLNACNIHDTCYATLGADKLTCDAEFGNNLQSACENSQMSDRYKSMCKAYANIYVRSVGLWGAGPFAEAQRIASTCQR